MQIKIRYIRPELSPQLPAYATPGSAGLDLCCAWTAPEKLWPGEAVLIPTNIAIHIAEPGWAGLIIPRSGLGHKHGLVLGNGSGLIDSDYQGEIYVSLLNRSTTGSLPYIVQPGERIAQLIFIKVQQVELELVTEFAPSARGEQGFGSTGS
jgi:dUTP pyrophosphatase